MATSTIKNKIMKLSQAEYTTLSTTGTLTKDGVTYTYSPTDTIYVTLDANSEHNYSTTEQIIGTWINGKTLYEKTLYSNNTAQVEDIPINVANIDEALIVGGYVDIGDSIMPLNTSFSAGSIVTYIRNSKQNVRVQLASWSPVKKAVTIQYTKTV